MSTSRGIRYIPAIDGLRAVAVIAVMLYHLGFDWIPGGFLGVDLFFVISGYVITRLLLDSIQMRYLMDFIKSSRQNSSVDIKFSCEAYVGAYENKVREGFFFCRAGINIGSVLADGSISACPNIDRKKNQGNILIHCHEVIQNIN